MWTIEHNGDVEDFCKALEYALSRIDEQCMVCRTRPNERGCEADWVDNLSPLWPAVREVAAMLLDGQRVSHDDVLAIVDRYRSA